MECNLFLEDPLQKLDEISLPEESKASPDFASFLVPSVQIELDSTENDALTSEIIERRCENLTFKLTQVMSLPDPILYEKSLPVE